MIKPATIKLTQWDGDPVYLMPAWVVAVRKPHAFEKSDAAMATRVEISGGAYIVRESVDTVVDFLGG